MQIRWWLALGALGAVALLTRAAGAQVRDSNHTARLKAHPVVALTFDDLPAGGGLVPGETRAQIAATLASALRAHHLKGIYGFVNAEALPDDPDVQQALRIWVGAEMNIGNHTWSHPSLNDVTAEAYEHDIALDEPALQAYSKGRDWRWFRYPYLEEGDTLAKRDAVRSWLGEHHYRIAQVTLTFNDDAWGDPYQRCLVKHDEAAIAWLKQSYLVNAAEFIRVGRQEEQIAFGHEIPNVLLLHETDFTALMLPDLLNLLHKQGFRFKTLAKVERNRAYSQDAGAALKDGGTLPNQYLNSRHLLYPPFTPEPYDKLNHLCQ
ncbi:MAG TPA: polysaccharide deacetylase family protein [Terracidiphilus sp.]|jgi:peptidoglycan-N-acetylglucosamine deacetylase|nr:polysaccharide deacetylase family protein [Terracidiphilus sp.]